MEYNCAGKILDLQQPRVMGILNITLDSFSDGGRFIDPQRALKHALAMEDAGAAIIDVGGESTRPGAREVSLGEELDRVIPVIELLRKELTVPISIDTYKTTVMREAINAGVGFINDINALQEPGALNVVCEAKVPVCLMHMQGKPATMQGNPCYTDVSENVCEFLAQRIRICIVNGIPKSHIIVDPGFWFW